MAAELATTLVVNEATRLEQAEAAVRGYCRWHIAPEKTAEDVLLDGTGTRYLALPTLHLVDVTSIEEDGVTVELADVQWSSSGLLWRAAGWTGNYRGVKVSFLHGHSPIPAEVTAVVQAVAQRAMQNPGSLVRAQDGPFSDTFSQTGFNQSLPIALLDAEKAILDAYRLPNLP